jgi:hypothetical protein
LTAGFRGSLFSDKPIYQWEFQDPKIEVLRYIKPYFAGIFPYIGVKTRPRKYGIGTSILGS